MPDTADEWVKRAIEAQIVDTHERCRFGHEWSPLRPFHDPVTHHGRAPAGFGGYSFFLALAISAAQEQMQQESGPSLVDEAHRLLREVRGVEAAFLIGEDEERAIIVAAVEHGVVDRDALLDIEDALVEAFGFLEIRVRAHQGRGPGSIAVGVRLF